MKVLQNGFSFYNSERWRAVKRQAIERATGEDGFVYDEIDGSRIIKAGDIIVHHVIELTDDNVNDYNISLNLDNLKVVSFAHHNQIHARYGAREYNKVVYWCYGDDAQDFVARNATELDIICNIQRLREACCISASRNKATDKVVFQLRDCLYDIIYTRSGKWRYAFIVTDILDERIALRLNAIPIGYPPVS